MNAFLTAMLAGHNASLKTLGESILQIGSASFKGISSARTDNKLLQEAGYEEMSDLQFDMTRTDYESSGIVIRSQVTVDNENYKVMNIHTGQHSPIVHLILAIDR